MLDLIPSLVTQEENDMMIELPTMEEVRKVVFQLSGASAAGLNILLAYFLDLLGLSCTGYL